MQKKTNKKIKSKLSGYLNFIGLFVCSPAAAPVGLVLQQGPRGMEKGWSRGLGEDSAFWVKQS